MFELVISLLVGKFRTGSWAFGPVGPRPSKSPVLSPRPCRARIDRSLLLVDLVVHQFPASRVLCGVGKFCLGSAYAVALVLWLGVACCNTNAQTTKTGGSNSRGSHKVVGCNKDSQCPSGQRCGFSSGCEGKGKCVVPSGNASCIDPGGRCGCDGRPVDIFCAVGSRTEFTSAPVDSVGPCPRTCTEEVGCGTRLVCEKGFCVKP